MKSPMLSRAWGFSFPDAAAILLGDGEAKSAIDAALDRIHFRVGHGRKRCGRDRFGSVHRCGAEDRLHDLWFRSHRNGFDLNRLGPTGVVIDCLRLVMLVMDGLRLTDFVAGRWRDTKERFQRSHGALDLLLAKLKAIKLPDNLVELGMCDLKAAK